MTKAQPPTIRRRLIALVLITVAPATLLTGGMLPSEYVQERERLESSTMATARALASALDQRLAVAHSALAVLATSRLLRQQDLRAFHEQAVEVQVGQQFSVIGLVAPDHTPVLNTLQPPGSVLRRPGAAAELDAVFAGRGPVTTNLFVGSVQGTPSVAVATPVMHDGAIVYALVGGIDPTVIAELLRKQKLPPGWVASVADRNGRLVARTANPERFIGTLARESLRGRMDASAEGTETSVNREGMPILSAFSTAPASGWRVLIGIPQAELTQDLASDLAWVGTGTFAVLLASLLLAWNLRRGLVESVEALKAQARRLGRGEAAEPIQASFLEAQELSAVFHQASSQLLETSHELRRQQEELAHSANRLGALVESAMDAVVSTDEHYDIVLFNHAAEAMFGWDRAAILGQSIDKLVPGHLREIHRKRLADFGRAGAAAGRLGAIATVTGRRANGEEFPLEASVSHVATASGTLFTAVIRDISEKIKAADDLIALRAHASAMREQDKKRIARELHDDAVQTLTVLKLEANWLIAQKLEPGAEQRVRRMVRLLDDGIVALRRIAADLRPAALDELGFAAALQDLCDTFTERTGVPCQLAMDPPLALDDPHATEIYRLVQEALSNVAKHARASRVEVLVAREGEELVVRIGDDGVGFVPDAARDRKSMGLAGLRERVELLRGTLRIDSVRSLGATIEVRAPAPGG